MTLGTILTAAFVALWLLGGAVYDLVAYQAQLKGDGETISQVFLHWDEAFWIVAPLTAMVLGCLEGHLYIPKEATDALPLGHAFRWAVCFFLGILIAHRYLWQRA